MKLSHVILLIIGLWTLDAFAADPPKRRVKYRNVPLAPTPGGILSATPKELVQFLVKGGWVDFAAAGKAGEKVLDSYYLAYGNDALGILAFDFDTSILNPPIPGNPIAPIAYIEGLKHPLGTRMHELGHLWLYYWRKTLGLPELPEAEEEVLIITKQLLNFRRTRYLTKADIDSFLIYRSENLRLLSEDARRELTALLYSPVSKHRRRGIERIFKQVYLGKPHALPSMLPHPGDTADVAGALAEVVYFGGEQLATWGARTESEDHLLLGSLVMRNTLRFLPGQSASEPRLETVINQAYARTKSAQVARDVLTGTDQTLAGHMKSEQELDILVGYHPGWCATKCAPGCPNSYQPNALQRWRDYVLGSPAVPGSEWDQRCHKH